MSTIKCINQIFHPMFISHFFSLGCGSLLTHTHTPKNHILSQSRVGISVGHLIREFPSDTIWRLIYPSSNREGPDTPLRNPNINHLPQPTQNHENRVATRLQIKVTLGHTFSQNRFISNSFYFKSQPVLTLIKSNN